MQARLCATFVCVLLFVGSAAAQPHLDGVVSLGGVPLVLRDGPRVSNRCDPPPNCRHVELPAASVALVVNVGVGFSLNDHHRTEIGLASTSAFLDLTVDSTYAHELVVTAAYTKGVFLHHVYDVRRWSIAQLYDFRPAARWRPYLGVGMALDHQTSSDYRREWLDAPLTEARKLSLIRNGEPFSEVETLPTSLPPSTTTTRLRPFGRAGVRVGRRFFFVMEAHLESGNVGAGYGVGIAVGR